jgi:hypothetical protein
MSDASDVIQESLDHAGESRINSRVALFVAITATFMAICNIKDGNIVQAMSQAQAHSIDAWSYFQAKSTKQAIAENAAELLAVQQAPGAAQLLASNAAKIRNYEVEKAQIKKQAEGFAKEYDDLNVFDDQFDMTEALLSISIAMFGITALTKKTWLLYFSACLSLIGIGYGLAAFLHISLHSDLMSKVLG